MHLMRTNTPLKHTELPVSALVRTSKSYADVSAFLRLPADSAALPLRIALLPHHTFPSPIFLHLASLSLLPATGE